MKGNNEKLLMARSNKRCWNIYKRIWFMSKNKEQNRDNSRKVNSKWDTRETVDILDSRFYHKVTISSRKGCNISSM